MPGESTEQPIQQNQPREFKFGVQETQALQKGRVTKLSNPNFGAAYLIDVTDREDPTAADSFSPDAPGKKISDIYKDELEDEKSGSIYRAGQNVVVAITNTLDPENRRRVYAGVASIDPENPQKGAIESQILYSAGFNLQDDLWLPYASDARYQENPKEHTEVIAHYWKKEILDAVKEVGDPNPFPELTKSATPLKPAA